MRTFWVIAGGVLVMLLGVSSPVLASDDSDLERLCRRLSGLDLNADGTLEIESLQLRDDLHADSERPGRLVIMLVEARLLEDLNTGEDRLAPDLRPALKTWCRDLQLEGWRARVMAVRLHASSRHQDGRTLLALREVLRAVRGLDPSLSGVVLLGRFPDAFLVRTVNWRKRTPLKLATGTPRERHYEKPVDYLRVVPEPVADRCDLVLSDLDGRWETLYVEGRERIPSLLAVHPGGVPAAGGITDAYQRGGRVFEDFFHLRDGRLEVREVVGEKDRVTGLHVVPLDAYRDRECSEADLQQPNPMARPDIVVSRIDASGVALRPRSRMPGASGPFLDSSGKPAVVRFEGDQPLPHWSRDLWEPDPLMERTLLLEFLTRNHRFRRGELEVSFRPASFACDLGSGYAVARRASTRWQSEAREDLDVKGRPSLLDFVTWLRRPAVMRTLRAHSDPWGSKLAVADVEALERACAGPIWCWSPQGRELVPSLRAAAGKGKLDFFLYQTLWRNRVLPDHASFWLHTGCDSITPPAAARLPYNHPRYGRRQGAESLLFFANGLALVGRAKVFYDEPRGFCEELARGRTFGEAWRRYFEIESAATSFKQVGGRIGRKRAYFWSVIGDWTLRLVPPESLQR